MDRPKTTPKDFFLWAGAMITLYMSIFSFISLIFSYINYAFPDVLAPQYYTDPYQGGVSYYMASLVVLVPLFLFLHFLISRSEQSDPSRREIWVRRWALFLTLFVAGAMIVIDLIILINTFLGGMLTTPFLLKVAVVLLVAAAGFIHFLADFWGYWNIQRARARLVGWSMGILTLLTICAGFLIIGTPMQARAYRLDAQKVSDLQTIQNQIVVYWQQHAQLPNALSDLNDAISGFTVPVDPQTGQSYSYQPAGRDSFVLCADFSAPTQGMYQITAPPPQPIPAGVTPGAVPTNWNHGAGKVCFDRTIDPSRYPVKQ